THSLSSNTPIPQPTTMALFKISKKNKTASAASTPSQTPRTSMQINTSHLDKTFTSISTVNPTDVEKLLKKTISPIGHNQALSLSKI
ncbi:hypothetical protein EC991_007316, partial [Linnemannia zychae]